MFDYRLSKEEYERILDIKRDLHMHPETAHKEVRTTDVIKNVLEEMRDFELLEDQPETGLIARIRGTGEGEEVMLRADIDAIEQTEKYDSPWKSLNEGVMHACGHDFHTASLLGTAMILKRAKKEGILKNTVDLVFQPAEEGTTGARMLIEDGLFDKISPCVCFGLHNWPSVESGNIVCHRGSLMAGKRSFSIYIKGSGGHGSMPHLNRDPIVCAAAVIQSLQTIVSRNTAPTDALVLSISRIEGGKPVNIVADDVTMVGTIRSLSDAALDRAIERVESIVRNTAEAYECAGEVRWQDKVPALDNSEKLLEFCMNCAKNTGSDVIDFKPSLASEDFALYQKVIPGFFYWVGSTPRGEAPEDLHRPLFHTDDRQMIIASELLARSAIEYEGKEK